MSIYLNKNQFIANPNDHVFLLLCGINLTNGNCHHSCIQFEKWYDYYNKIAPHESCGMTKNDKMSLLSTKTNGGMKYNIKLCRHLWFVLNISNSATYHISTIQNWTIHNFFLIFRMYSIWNKSREVVCFHLVFVTLFKIIATISNNI